MALQKITLNKTKILFDKSQETNSQKGVIEYLIDFADEYQTKPDLQFIVTELTKKELESCAQSNNDKQLASDELDGMYTECKKYTVSIPSITNELMLFHAYDNEDPDKNIDTTWDPIIEKLTVLLIIFNSLLSLGTEHFLFICKFIPSPLWTMNYCGRIPFELATPKYTEWFETNEKLKLAQISTVYYHWNIIDWMHKIYHKGEELADTLNKQGKVLKAGGILTAHRKIKCILLSTNEDTLSSDDKFDLVALKRSIEKVWLHTLDNHDSESTQVKKKFPKALLMSNTQNIQNGTLLIGAYKINFPRKKRKRIRLFARSHK